MLVCCWWWFRVPFVPICPHCHLHHLLLPHNPDWFGILVPAYPGCPENWPLISVSLLFWIAGSITYSSYWGQICSSDRETTNSCSNLARYQSEIRQQNNLYWDGVYYLKLWGGFGMMCYILVVFLVSTQSLKQLSCTWKIQVWCLLCSLLVSDYSLLVSYWLFISDTKATQTWWLQYFKKYICSQWNPRGSTQIKKHIMWRRPAVKCLFVICWY